jgi:hypothetical protein
MGKKISVKLPNDFRNSLFFEGLSEITVTIHDDLEENLAQSPFIYDLCDRNEIKLPMKPWNNWETSIPYLLKYWKKLDQSIQESFQNHKGKADRHKMLQSLSYYLLFIHWLNNQPVQTLSFHPFSQFSYKPVNVEERLKFIMQKPEQYHSFIQLQQLFHETEKLFYKRKALDKLKNSDDQ